MQVDPNTVAFLLLGEPQHVFHAAPVACAMARVAPHLRALFVVTDAALIPLLREVEAVYGVVEPLPVMLLEPPITARLLGALTQRHRSYKALTLKRHRRVLDAMAAIVAAERTSTALRAYGVTRPRLIHIPHGAGDRRQGYDPRIALFDLTLVAGSKDARRMLAEGLIRPGHYAVSGYIKRDLVQRRVGHPAALFDNARPTVLYNAHFDRALSSWHLHARAIIAAFAAQDRFNLVVAPHVKLFVDASRRERACRLLRGGVRCRLKTLFLRLWAWWRQEARSASMSQQHYRDVPRGWGRRAGLRETHDASSFAPAR